MLRKLIVWVSIVSFVCVQSSAVAGPHDDGTAAGQAANAAMRPKVNSTDAQAAVPGYTTAPPQSALYGAPNLAGQANTKLAACLSTPADPSCQALIGAMKSANTPRPYISPHDPAVAAARGIARNPSTVLGSLASYYTGCTTTEVSTPSGVEQRVCNRYAGVGNYSCRRDLTVGVALTPSCAEGTWFAHGKADRNALDHMTADAQCRIRADGKQRFKFYAYGGNGACIGEQFLDLPTTPVTAPALVTDLSPHWQGYCWNPFKVVVMPGSGCVGPTCNYTFQYGTPTYACPAPAQSGSSITGYFSGDTLGPGPAEQCFRIEPPDLEGVCAAGAVLVPTASGMSCAVPAATGALTGASGWSIPLSFAKPTMTATATDSWEDRCPTLPAGGRCMPTTSERCVDGPATKQINGQDVTRACWAYERTMSCSSGAPVDECAPLVATGCTPVATTCRQTAPSGLCEVYQDTYNCPIPAFAVTTASACPGNVFCLGTSCFNTSYTNDTDFARSMSMMEAAREAGAYIDVDRLTVFNGEDNRCRDRLLNNCCYTNGAGAGMSNQSMFGTGSTLVYDVLMNSTNQQFITQGIAALLSGAGFSGSFTTYGVTIAVNGAAVPAGSVVVASTGTGTGAVTVAFDPWSLVIAVIIYVILSAMSCNENEGKLALKRGARLCHEIGSYCSHKTILGCTTTTHTHCCFNSTLARVVNEQGRTQVAKAWGSPQAPDCSGFSIAQLQSLDFGAMDLSEFYASIVPTLPNVGAIQTNNSGRAPACYFGQGKC